jgi:hypothetical protein
MWHQAPLYTSFLPIPLNQLALASKSLQLTLHMSKKCGKTWLLWDSATLSSGTPWILRGRSYSVLSTLLLRVTNGCHRHSRLQSVSRCSLIVTKNKILHQWGDPHLLITLLATEINKVKRFYYDRRYRGPRKEVNSTYVFIACC